MKTPPLHTTQEIPRSYYLLMTGAALLLAGSLIAGIFLPPGLTWGFHFLQFVSATEAILYVSLLVGTTLYFFLPRSEQPIQRLALFQDRSPRTFAGISICVFIATAFLLRIRIPLLGDGFYIVRHFAQVGRGESPLDPRNEPLATYFFYHLMKATGQAGYYRLLDAFFYAELVLGAAYIFTVYTLVRSMTTDTTGRLLGFLLLLSLPSMQVFFGYVEVYSLPAFVLALYALAGVLALRDRLSVYLAALLLVLCILVHYLAALLVPSFVYLLYRTHQARPQEALRGALIVATAAAAIVIGLHGDIGAMFQISPHNHYLSAFSPGDEANASSEAYPIFSLFHASDIGNYFILMAAGSIAVAGVGALRKRAAVYESMPSKPASGSVDPGTGNAEITRFFILAFLPIAAFLAVAKFDLGAARDWDVCAPYFIFLALAAASYTFGRPLPAAGRRTAGLCIALALLESVIMFRVNASPAAITQRYHSLFDRRVISNYAAYSGHLYLSLYYSQTGARDSALALWRGYSEEYPHDRRGYLNTANILERMKMEGRAVDDSNYIALYERWIAAIPDDPAPLQNYDAFLIESGNARFNRGDLTVALDRYRTACAIDSTNPTALNNLGSVLAQMGKPDLAIVCFQRSLQHAPRYGQAYYNLGNAYIDKGDYEKGKQCFRAAASLGIDTSGAARGIDSLRRRSAELARR